MMMSKTDVILACCRFLDIAVFDSGDCYLFDGADELLLDADELKENTKFYGTIDEVAADLRLRVEAIKSRGDGAAAVLSRVDNA